MPWTLKVVPLGFGDPFSRYSKGIYGPYDEYMKGTS